MPNSGKHNVNNIDSFFKVRPSRTTIREGETISFLEKGKLVKQEKRNGVVYETIYVEQGTQEVKSTTTTTTTSSSGDITSVTAGTGLSGGGVSGPVTLNIDSTVVTLTGTQTLTNKTLTAPTLTGTTTATRINLGSTDTSSFLTGDPKIAFNGYMMLSGIVNETETGSTPAAIVFGNNSTYGNDQISLITAGQNRLYINSSGNITISQDLTVSGDLQVNGTTTTVNQTNLDVSDNIIGLNRGVSNNTNDSGLIIERGSAGDNAAILWDETASKFTLGTTTATPSDTGDITVATGTLVADLQGNVTGNATGNAGTATKLANARDISLTGVITGVTSGAGFDGSAAVSIATSISDDSVALGTKTTGNYVATITAGQGLASNGATSGEGISHTLSLDLSELPTSTSDGDGDFFAVVDSADAQKKLTKGNINLSGFNNDSGFTSNAGTVTSVAVAGGNGLTSSGGAITSSGTITLAVGSDTLSVGADKVDLSASALTAVSDVVGSDGFIFFDASATPANSPRLGTVSDLPFTNNAGTVTNVATENGITGGPFTTTGTLGLDFSTLTDMTGDISGTTEFILQNGTTESRKAASEIKLSYFNNDSNWTSNAGTVTSITVTGGNGLTGGGSAITSSGTVTLNVGEGTGIDVTADAISLDVSDVPSLPQNVVTGDNFLVYNSTDGTALATISELQSALSIPSASGTTNGVVTLNANGTLTGESNLTFTGTLLTNTGDIKIASGSLGVNTNANGSNGRIAATSHIEAGVGSGAIGLTINDGGGNSNVTFNHTGKVPEQNGNSGRIEVNTDSIGGQYMAFELAGNVTSGVSVNTDEKFRIDSAGADVTGQLIVTGQLRSSGNGGFTIGNYSGYDRIQNSSNSFSFLTDANGYADMTFGTVTAGTWQGTAINATYVGSLPASKITSGTFADARIASATEWNQAYAWGDHSTAGYLTSVPNLDASKITSGTFSSARMPASFAADSVTKDDITTRAESGFYQTSTGTTGEGWPITNNSYQHMIATTHSNDSNYYSMQIAGSFYDQNFYGRKTNGSGTTSWLRFITTADEGSGNGFDADTLDGYHQSSFTRKGVQSGTPNTASSRTTFTCNDAINVTTGNQSGLEVWQDTVGADAFMTFHVANDYAVYFGLDGGTNDLAVGGWSRGANSYKIWHQGNDGSGSTLDADLLDGLHGSSYWSKSGSWVGDLGSNGYTRVQGVSNGGGEFVLALKNGQLHTLIDGSYIAYEGSSAAGGGFWSSYNSSYGNASGFVASANDKIRVQQLDGGTADLEVTGNIKLTNERGLLWDYTPNTGLGGYIAHPGGGMYRTSTGTHTGALTITIPTGGGPADMISFWVDVFDYTTYESQSFYIAGYVYQTAGSNEWVNETAMMFTPKTNHARTIRFGHNGTNHVVYIGELADTWSYPQVTVRNVQIGYGADVDTYNDNWDISFEASSFQNVDATYTGADTLPSAGKITMTAGAGKFVHNTTSSRDKIRVWSQGNYAIGMQSGFTFGGLENQYAMTFQMNNQSTERGFWWGDDGHGQGNGAMALTTAGELTLAHSLRVGYGESDTTTPGATYRLDVSGSIGATADVVAYISSDKRLKDNIKNIQNPLEKLQKLNGVEFDWNDKQDLYKGHDIGVIAQEVEEVLPEIVDTREDGHKAVKYDRMVALLIEVAKEQQQQINYLKEKLNG